MCLLSTGLWIEPVFAPAFVLSDVSQLPSTSSRQSALCEQGSVTVFLMISSVPNT